MQKKLVVVTGASSGLGACLADLSLREGCDLVLVNRSESASTPQIERLRADHPDAMIDVIAADLADQDAVADAAAKIARRHPRVDVLFNNAGVLLGDLRSSKHGNELHFQVNTLAPYMLTRLLGDSLSSARGTVVNVSSGAISMTGPLRLDELRWPQRLRKLFGAYAQSKLALTALTNGLAAEYLARGVLLRSMDPGGNRTKMTAGDGMPRPLLWLRPFFFKSPERGARAIYDSAFDRRFAGQTGIYVVRGKVARPPQETEDPAMQSALLALCRELTGV